jgi:hypothetical protein
MFVIVVQVEVEVGNVSDEDIPFDEERSANKNVVKSGYLNEIEVV